MATTKLDVINLTLMMLGRAPVTTLDNGDKLVVSAEKWYNVLVPSELSRNNWRFATQIVQLSQSLEEPPDPWSTIYQLPAGWLRIDRLYPSIKNFELYQQNKLYTSHSGELWADYVFYTDESFFPPSFQKYMACEIAKYLGPFSAQNQEFYPRIKMERDTAFAEAAAVNSMNRPNSTGVSFPVLEARGILYSERTPDVVFP